jgi:hypothetical protein
MRGPRTPVGRIMHLGSALIALLALTAGAGAEPIEISASPVHLSPERPDHVSAQRRPSEPLSAPILLRIPVQPGSR